MRRFWTVYITVAFLGTAGVYVAAPLARPYVAKWSGASRMRPAPPPLDDPVVPLAQTTLGGDGPAIEPELTVTQPEETAEVEGSVLREEQGRSPATLGVGLVSRGDRTPLWGIACRRSPYFMMDGLPTGVLEAGKRIDYRRRRPSGQGSMVEFMIDSPGGIPTTPYLVSETNVVLFSGDYSRLTPQQNKALNDFCAAADAGEGLAMSELPPLPASIVLVLRGDRVPTWGVVRCRASRFQMDGRRDGFVEAGSLVDCQRTVSSSGGPVVECLLLATNGPSAARCLIEQGNLHLFTGHYRRFSDTFVRDMQEYYRLNGNILLRRLELLQESASKNPYFRDCQAAYRALTAHVEKSRVEVDRRDRALGAERVNEQEQLFRLRMEERKLRMDYEEIEKKFKEWRSEHADVQRSPDADMDLKVWTARKRALVPHLAGLALEL